MRSIALFIFLKEIPQGRFLKFKVPHPGFEPWAGASRPVAFATAPWVPRHRLTILFLCMNCAEMLKVKDRFLNSLPLKLSGAIYHFSERRRSFQCYSGVCDIWWHLEEPVKWRFIISQEEDQRGKLISNLNCVASATRTIDVCFYGRL